MAVDQAHLGRRPEKARLPTNSQPCQAKYPATRDQAPSPTRASGMAVAYRAMSPPNSRMPIFR